MVTLEWLQNVGYGVCEACNRILSSRFRGRCPSCWPAYIASLPRPVTGRPLSEDMPPFEQVLSARVRLRSSVPRGARDLWGACLNAALAVLSHIVTPGLGWIFSCSLLWFFPSPARGGSSRTKRSTKRDQAKVHPWSLPLTLMNALRNFGQTI